MSKKAVVFPLSLLSQQDDMAAVHCFRKHGLDLLSLVWSLRPGGALKSTINSYRLGYLTTDDFRDAVRDIFPKLNISDEEFDSAWQSRLNPIEKIEDYYQTFSKLQAEGHRVVLVAGTNELDFRFHQQEVKHFAQDEPRYLLSYQTHLIGHDLLKLAYEQIKADGVQAEDIVQVMSEPIAPQAPQGVQCLNPLAWTAYFIENVFFQQKYSVYEGLRTMAENEGITLYTWPVDKSVDEALISLEETLHAALTDLVAIQPIEAFEPVELMPILPLSENFLPPITEALQSNHG
ncbi:MAG: hypothetical protein U1E78_07075 [Gammaproteobacteria bacterium]